MANKLHLRDVFWNYLMNRLPEWDGVPRCYKLLARGFGATGNDLELASVKMIASIAKAALGDEILDRELIWLTGPQDCGKSQALRALFGETLIEHDYEATAKSANAAAKAGYLACVFTNTNCGWCDSLPDDSSTLFIICSSSPDAYGAAISTKINPMPVGGPEWIEKHRNQLFAEAMAWRPA